jgi:type IV pilus assembly protein PilM
LNYSELSLGLDIGSSYVKLVALSRRPEQWALKHVALSSLPEGSIVDGEVMDSGAVADSIEALFTQLGLDERRVISGISGRAVIVKPIRIPTTNPDELAQSVSWEAEQYLPSLDDVNLDYHVIETGENFTEVLLVAAKRERLEAHLMILRLAGLEALAIDVDSFALGNCFELAEPEAARGTVALVNVGASLTNVNVLSAGSPRFTRDISFGGYNYTEALARELELSVADAEAAKRGGLDGVDLAAVDAVVGETTLELVDEISRTLTHFTGTNPELVPDAVVLSGGCSGMLQIKASFEDALAIPVRRLDPLASIDLGESEMDFEDLGALAPHLAVGIGLAIRGEDPEFNR